jgi:hypothetical protein
VHIVIAVPLRDNLGLARAINSPSSKGESQMTQFELTADVLKRNLEMFVATLSDFSDADFYTRPCPGANSPAWQVGHLIGAETWMINSMAPGVMPKLPDGFDKKFSKENCSKDEPGFFGTKAELIDLLTKTRNASIAWVKTLTPADLDKPGPEPMRKFIPTLGHTVELLPTHLAMHMGQIQVTRRKLGKPVMF